MMDDGADASRREVTRAVKRAIVLNEYLLRRAWGVLYIVLALSMFLSIFGASILEIARSFGIVGEMAVDMTASGCAVIVILWAFKRVRNTANITHPEGQRTWSSLLGYRFLVPLWIGLNVLVIATFVLARAQVPLIDLLIHFGLAIYLYYALRLSFSKKIPEESLLAIASLSLFSLTSISLLSIITNPAPYALLEGATILIWILCGIYARTRAIPEFEEELTGLE